MALGTVLSVHQDSLSILDYSRIFFSKKPTYAYHV